MLEVKVARDSLDWAEDIVQVLICETDFAGQVVALADPVVLRRHEQGTPIERSFKLPRESAQRLMDGLWECGLRPVEGAGSAGSLAATERHLKDMQRLVFEGRPSHV